MKRKENKREEIKEEKEKNLRKYSNYSKDSRKTQPNNGQHTSFLLALIFVSPAEVRKISNAFVRTLKMFQNVFYIQCLI